MGSGVRTSSGVPLLQRDFLIIEYIINCTASVVVQENVAPLIPRFKILTSVVEPKNATIIEIK